MDRLKQFFLLCLMACLAFNGLKAQSNLNVHTPHNTQVNMRTGNFFYQRTDLFIQCQGLSLDITFSYNTSLDTANFGYGYGWVFNYGMSYLLDSMNNVIITRIAGRRDTFKVNGPGYDAPTNVFDELANYDTDKYRLTTRYGRVYYFEDATHKKLTKIEDSKGNSLTMAYNAGLISSVTHSNGRSIGFTWSNGFLVSLLDNNDTPARTVTYAFADDNLISVTDPLGFEEKYKYGSLHQLVEIRDRNGSPLVINFSSGQRVRKIISCLGEESFTYSENKSFRVRKGTPEDRITTYEFNDLGQLINVTDEAGFLLSYTYDGDGNVASFTDLNGNTTTYTYDGMGNMLSTTDPNGFTLTNTYTSTNRVSSQTDKNGRTTIYTYDGDDNLIHILHPDQETQSMTYDAFGNLKSVTNEAGNTFTIDYDSFGNVMAMNYPIGSETFEYNDRSNVTKIINAEGEETMMTYDALFRVKSVQDDQGNTVTYNYDGNGNAISELDPNSVLKTYTYDALNRLTEVQIDGAITRYTYDGFGQLKSIVDGNGNAMHYTHDVRGLLTEERDGQGNTTTYTYDGNENILSQTNPDGISINYTYDPLDRMTSRSYPENTDVFSYDQMGNLINTGNDNINVSYAYDERNRLIQKSINSWGKTISYDHNPAGNRTLMVDPDGGQTTYTYDANNRLSTMTNALGTTTMTYDSVGRLTRQDNANGTYSTYFTNNAHRLEQINHYNSSNALISSYDYAFDNQGNRLSRMDHNSVTDTYFYDGGNRLDSVSYGNGNTASFTYDAAGNRSTCTENGMTQSYAYDASNHLVSAGNTNYAFDLKGNLIEKSENGDTTSFIYDAIDRLIGIIHPTGAISTFQYDPFGNRVAKFDTNGIETRYVHDYLNVLLELNNSNVTQARYTSGLAADSWLAMERGGNAYYYHKDALLSTVQLTDAGENVAQAYEYDVFGEIANQTTSLENPFTFTGREKEMDNDLYYYRTRYYDPATGRFQSRDNFFGFLRRPGTLHRYLYVENNPTTYIDQNGQLFFIPILIYGGAALAGAATGVAVGSAINSQRDFHTKRNWLNQTPGQSPPGPEWEKQPDWKNEFHQPDNVDPDNPFPNKKYLLPDETGGSSEAILQPDGSYLTSGPKQGTYNYYHPEGFWGNTGHVLWDVLPHFFNDDYEDCDDDDNDDDDNDPDGDDDDGDGFNIPRVHAVDPNEVLGEIGFDSSMWVSINDRLAYTIFYENDPDFATAPAQIVEIRLPVHENLNIFSVQLGNFGFGFFSFDVPENTTFYQNRLDVRDSLNVFVDVTAGIDVVANEIFWIFESIDPLTGLPPEDALTGFLPVNDTSIGLYNDTLPKRGEGYVTYTIKSKSSVMTGDTATAQAEIIFDINAPLKTNIWTNLIDAFPPASQIDTAIDNGSVRTLNWSGADDPGGVGIAYYDLYVSRDSGDFLIYTAGIDTNFFDVTGVPGSIYAFYTRATDNVGNQEPPKVIPEIEVTFGTNIWPGGPIAYVDLTATSGNNDGTSWDDAFLRLEDALALADEFTNVEEIWVAQGTYYPTQDNDRSKSYVLKKNMKIYGGFAGFETERTARSPFTQPVFLSGNIGNISSLLDNSYHVVTLDNSCIDCVVDGFNIQFGYATGGGTFDNVGGGLLSFGAGTLKDSRIRLCNALSSGAAIYNSGPLADLEVTGCFIDFNLSISGDKDVVNRNAARMEFIGLNTIKE